MLQKIGLGFATLLIATMGLAPAVVSADSPATNLIANPGLEMSATGTTPDSWQSSDYVVNAGDNNGATFSYLNTGHAGSHSVRVDVTTFKSGDDNWYYADAPIAAGATYQFSDWYQSNANTEVDAEVVVNGAKQYFRLGSVAPSDGVWANYTSTFTAPAGATAMSIYHLIATNGYLTTDDYSMVTYTPTPFNRAIVSVAFDDGWLNQYQNATPVMEQDGLVATYYIISGELTNPDEAGYMTSQQVLSLYQAGNEIGSHTVHHCDLTGVQTDNPTTCPIPITATQVNAELQDSQATLQALIGTPVTDFAYPYGAYNAATIANAKQYYQSQRTVNAGFNSKDSFDVTQLKMYEVDANITQAQVQAWVSEAIAQKTWLILCYHEVATTPNDSSDTTYTTLPSNFSAEMSYLKTSGVAVETVSQALAEISPQLAQKTTTPGDANGDGKVNVADLSILASNWGTLSGATLAMGDFNGDGKVNVADLSILASNWGK